MLGLFSQNSMLLCGMQGNNSCSSHRTISVKIETFFLSAEQNFALCHAVDYFIFSIHALHLPQIITKKRNVLQSEEDCKCSLHECTGFYIHLIHVFITV